MIIHQRFLRERHLSHREDAAGASCLFLFSPRFHRRGRSPGTCFSCLVAIVTEMAAADLYTDDYGERIPSALRAADEKETSRAKERNVMSPLCGHCAPVLRGFPANRAAPAACALGDLHSKGRNAGWAVYHSEYFRKITTIYRDDKNYIFAFPDGICIINATLQLYI